MVAREAEGERDWGAELLALSTDMEFLCTASLLSASLLFLAISVRTLYLIPDKS
jgi:hypothetical protein